MISFRPYATHLAYISVGIISIVFAVFISSKLVRSANSQEAEPAAEVQVATPPAESIGAESAQSATKMPSENVGFLEPYVFDIREGRRNPFRSPQIVAGNLPDVILPGTPLERYELNELRLAGIMWDVKSPKAMIIDPQGEVHVIGKDDRIGRKRGYIAVIREGEVVVVETSSFNGENTYSSRVLRIEK